MFLILPFYLVSFVIVSCPFAESFWRMISGVRPLRIKKEKKRLNPLFEEVYGQALKFDNDLSDNIEIFIQENMSINALAYGGGTLVLTKGSIDLLSDDCLKGLIAHELGHFSNRDTTTALFMSIGNLPMTLLMKFLTETKTKIDEATKRAAIMGLFKIAFDGIYYIFRGIELIGELIIMPRRRQSEYDADIYAVECGYGSELAEALTQIYEISTEKPQSVKELIKSTHPSITKRVENIEGYLD